MTSIELFVQVFLDGVLLNLCVLGVLGRPRRHLGGLLLLSNLGVCLVSRLAGCSTNPVDYVVLPLDSFLFSPFLVLTVLLLNSIYFDSREGHILWGTVTQFSLFLLFREVCFVLLGLFGLSTGFLPIYGARILSLLLWAALWCTGMLRWIKDQLEEGDIPLCIVAGNTFLVLLLILGVWKNPSLRDYLWLPILAAILALLVLVDGIVLLWDQNRIQFQRRGRLLEQYLPMVEELVESVRARQHEYNNRMMAISAAMVTSKTLEEAQRKVAELAGQVSLEATDRELLKCDSKVLCGMLFGKVKQAQLHHIQFQISIASSFLHRSLSESDWVDLLGILLDNALEAASAGDLVLLLAEEEEGALCLLVSNPCPPMSRTEMAQMFRRGWSTKAEQGRGYGLFNVRRMVEQHGGKIIVKNEEKNGQNYLTIGALVS